MKDLFLRKVFRRMFVLSLCAGMGIFLLSGCGNSGSGNSGSGTDTNQEKTEVSSTVKDDASALPAPQADTSETASEELLPDSTEYEPNQEYDKFAKVEYVVDDIGAEFTATVSAKEDGSQYEVHCVLEGVEQVVVLDKDLEITSNLTGDLVYDAPLIVQQAIDEDTWTKIE